MKTLKHGVRLAVMLAICMLMASCSEPASDLGGMDDEFEVALGFPRGMGAASRGEPGGTINTDSNVEKVYAKVFSTTREHLPSTDASGVTELTKNEVTGKWSATVRLAADASGTITFFVWGVNASGEHLYSGDGNLTVGTNDNSIIVTTGAGYSLRDMGPGGGYIFYDKGSYSSGWRYLEAARADLGSPTTYIFGYYLPVVGDPQLVGTGTDVGTGAANTAALVNAMGEEAYTTEWGDSYGDGDTKTAEYAAKLCDGHSAGGYSDWFLPSKDELTLMSSNLDANSLGDFIEDFYWSSSENDAYGAWYQYFNYEYQQLNSRSTSCRVRPVRAF